MQRQAIRNLRNPYSKKTKSPIHLLLGLSIILTLFLSIIYFLATNAFLPLEPIDTDISRPISKSLSNSNASLQIAYAISLTSCSKTPSLVDGAAILAHSIHLSSSRTSTSNSKYDYKLYAIVHKTAMSCKSTLETLGYEILEVDIPVPVSEIQGDFLRERVPKNGCCGALEFIKLWAYTLVDHPFVVHLDLDTMVLKPMDELFDAAIEGDTTKMKDSIMWPREHHDTTRNTEKSINAFFTRDYNMRPARRGPVGVQGGFIVLRPSMQTFREFQDIIRKGDYTSNRGWGGKGFGPFYGAMTFQGIIPYYYDALKPGTAVELNRCLYNTMGDNPRDKKTVKDVVSGNCQDGREDCEDCRERNIGEIFTAHFTLCQKPWQCLHHNQDMLQHRLCRKLFHEWYRIRANFEKPSVAEDVVVGEGGYQPEHFRGFCKASGAKGYIPLRFD